MTLTVNDDDGGTDTDTASVTVANADPVANAGVDKTGTEGSSVSFTFNCTDAGVNDTWDASVDWGDGSADTTFAAVTATRPPPSTPATPTPTTTARRSR